MAFSHPTLTTETWARLSRPVPRYTSYPSTPHFNNEANGSDDYSKWLGDIHPDAKLSLYFHIPFCDRLCWFCACHTKHTLKYKPIKNYLSALKTEIAWVAERLNGRGIVTSIHLGGGSPSLLAPSDLLDLRQDIKASFLVSGDAEISVEMDPNDLTGAQLDGIAAFGITRASFGVQDFEPVVQQAINRIQSFEQTHRCISDLRERGVRSINIDALYGLPHQTVSTISATAEKILSLSPERIALFGYAHVPWHKKHQSLIPSDALPDTYQRFEQQDKAGNLIAGAGYLRVGFDHFAVRSDTLAIAARNGRLRRNFQGYTDDNSDALIGFGASALGRFPQGYIQNVTSTSQYERRVISGDSAIEKSHVFSQDDLQRAKLIEQLLCTFDADLSAAADSDSALWDDLSGIALNLMELEGPQFIEWDGKVLTLTERARPFARYFASAFDTYFCHGHARHSLGI